MSKGQIKQKQATIKKSEFEELCKIQCTEAEIMAVLGVSKDTLLRWCKVTYGTDFATIYAEKKENGKMSLRRTQLRLAETNASMAIFLGKQYLGQRDNVDVKLNNEEDDALTLAIKESINK